MALYTLLFVSCSHCKACAWTLLAWSPGLLPVEAGRHWLDLPRPADAISFALAFIVTVSMVLSLAWLIRRSRWVRFTSIAVALVMFSVFATCTLAMIRS